MNKFVSVLYPLREDTFLQPDEIVEKAAKYSASIVMQVLRHLANISDGCHDEIIIFNKDLFSER